jgi:hypothetical protein
MINEVPVIVDDDAPKGYAFAFNKSALKFLEQVGPSWLEQEGGGIFQLALSSGGAGSGFSSNWIAWFKWYCALVSVAPNRTGRLEFCSDDVPN